MADSSKKDQAVANLMAALSKLNKQRDATKDKNLNTIVQQDGSTFPTGKVTGKEYYTGFRENVFNKAFFQNFKDLSLSQFFTKAFYHENLLKHFNLLFKTYFGPEGIGTVRVIMPEVDEKVETKVEKASTPTVTPKPVTTPIEPKKESFLSKVMGPVIGGGVLLGLVGLIEFLKDKIPILNNISWDKIKSNLPLIIGVVAGIGLIAWAGVKAAKAAALLMFVGTASIFFLTKTVESLITNLEPFTKTDWEPLKGILISAGALVVGMGVFAGVVGKFIQANPVSALAGAAALWGAIELVGRLATNLQPFSTYNWDSIIGSMKAAGIAVGGMSTLIGLIAAAFTATGGIGAVAVAGAEAALWGAIELIGYTATQLGKFNTLNLDNLKALAPVLNDLGGGLLSVMSLKGASAGMLNIINSLVKTDPVSVIKSYATIDALKLRDLATVLPFLSTSLDDIMNKFTDKVKLDNFKFYLGTIKQELIWFSDVVNKISTPKFQQLQSFFQTTKGMNIEMSIKNNFQESLSDTNKILIDQLKVQQQLLATSITSQEMLSKMKVASTNEPQNIRVAGNNAGRTNPLPPVDTRIQYQQSPYYA